MVQPLINLDAWHGHAQANHQVAAHEFTVQRARQELSVGVTGAYYGVKTVAERKAAVSAALEAARRALAMAQAANDEGLAPPVDVYRARADVATREAQLAKAEGELVSRRERLRELLGIEDQRTIVLLDPVPSPVPPHPDEGAASARNDVRALQQGLEAAESGLRRARARLLPRINLLARQQWVGDLDLVGGDLDGWLVALTVRWTPFAGMDQLGERAEARARRSQIDARLRALRNRAAAERSIAEARWQSAYSSWQASAAAVTEAAAAAELAQARYREGVGNMTELLGAQAALVAARVERSEARYRAVLSAENYRLAAGSTSLAEEAP